ncbi:MAG: hypothetical protein OXF01_12115 [Gemmatimonadetes bacterium]|nr:hypothetical protein [Gemmatimonadota bacterium]
MLIAFGGSMMGSAEHLCTLARLIGPEAGSLDEYVPAAADPDRLTMDVITGRTSDYEEVVVYRYSMPLSRLALYDGPVTFRKFRVTPEGPHLVSEEERSSDEIARLRSRGSERARARLAEQYGEDWHQEVTRIVASEEEGACPLCLNGDADSRPTVAPGPAQRMR